MAVAVTHRTSSAELCSRSSCTVGNHPRRQTPRSIAPRLSTQQSRGTELFVIGRGRCGACGSKGCGVVTHRHRGSRPRPHLALPLWGLESRPSPLGHLLTLGPNAGQQNVPEANRLLERFRFQGAPHPPLAAAEMQRVGDPPAAVHSTAPAIESEGCCCDDHGNPHHVSNVAARGHDDVLVDPADPPAHGDGREGPSERSSKGLLRLVHNCE